MNLTATVQAPPSDTATPTTVAPTAAQVQPLLTEAIRRWALVEDAALVARLTGVDVVFADLAGGELAEYLNGQNTLDVDAAGHGWFVDPTPRSDGEYGGSGATLAVRNGVAAGGFDMLSVLVQRWATRWALPTAKAT